MLYLAKSVLFNLIYAALLLSPPLAPPLPLILRRACGGERYQLGRQPLTLIVVPADNEFSKGTPPTPNYRFLLKTSPPWRLTPFPGGKRGNFFFGTFMGILQHPSPFISRRSFPWFSFAPRLLI